MPVIDANVSKFMHDSDFPMDKAIYLKPDSFVVPSPTAGSYYSVAHGLDFIPLVGGSWSTTSDFSVNYDYGSGTIPSSNPSASLFNVSLEILADATNIYIVPTNVSGSSLVVYVRVFGLEPSDSISTLSANQSFGDNFILNSDDNFTKLFSAGIITGVTAPSTNTVTHNLGIFPQVSTWATSTSRSLVVGSVFLTNVRYPIYLTNFATSEPDDISVKPSTSNVVFTTGSLSNANRIDYRIYYDETGVF